MEYDFDTAHDRRNTGSLKWDRYPSDVIPMWVADMDFRSPPAIIEALTNRVDHGIFGYAHPDAELSGIVTDMLRDRYKWDVSPNWIVWLPGLVTGLNVACRATGKPGDAVISTVPIYPPFLSAPELSQRTLLTVPMVDLEGRWRLDMDELGRSADRKPAMFLFCNPHNPCGRVYTREELEEIADFCERHDVILCSDEIHCDLLLDAVQHVPIATLNKTVAERTITLMAPSKTYNIPGLGCSFAVIPNTNLRQRFKRSMRGIVPEVNALGFVACAAAYKECGPWLQQLLAYLTRNRDNVTRTIAEIPGISMNHVEATYLAWIDVRQIGLQNPTRHFVEHGVALSDGRVFGRDGFVRLNFGCSESTLQEGLRRITSAMAAL